MLLRERHLFPTKSFKRFCGTKNLRDFCVFGCSEIKTSYHPHPKGCGLISDIIKSCEMTIYSHSRISTFEQCPLKFKFKYIDNLTPEIKQTIEGFLGNKVHETLEWIYQQLMNQQQVQLDNAIEFYIQIWNKDFNKEIKITKENNDAEYYFNKGIKFIIDYFLSNHPFKDNTIAIEKQILIDLDEEGKYKIQGYIDRLVFNKEANSYEIHDYKTGASIKSQEEVDKDRQLAIYSLGIKKHFENADNITLIWHFLDFNKKMFSKRTDEQLEELRKEIIELIKKIESTTEFQANSSGLCNWCEFQGYCETIKSADNPVCNDNKTPDF